MYHALFTNGKVFEQPITKVVCVGRNYAEHAKELNNPIPDEPILFIKPESSVVDLHEVLNISESDCHYETELAVLIGSELKNGTPEAASQCISGLGLALDLTRRSLQTKLKEKSHPWEIAKGFDGACPLSQFIPIANFNDVEQIYFSFSINEEIRQVGDSKDMITSVTALISYISRCFTLRAGDVVLTGTPKGVGVLNVNDQLSFNLKVAPGLGFFNFVSSTKTLS